MTNTNRILIIIVSTLHLSCNDISVDEDVLQLPPNSTTVQVQLIDSLGIVTLSVPIRYDTNFSWVHLSDCGKPCNERKYRFQPKELNITQESGFFWKDGLKDSVEHFTISHTEYFPFHNGDTTKNVSRHEQIKAELMSSVENPPIVFDTIQKIHDRYFSIIAMEKSGAKQSKKILAITTIKSNEIKFKYELLTIKNDSIVKNFIKNSIELIKTIHISKGI